MRVLSYEHELRTYWEIDSDCVVCPYCFHEHEDSWEFKSLDDGETKLITCVKCDKEFRASKEIHVTYITSTSEAKGESR